MLTLILGLIAILLEATAVLQLAQGSANIWSFMGLHSLACLLFALSIWRCLPEYFRSHRYATIALLFNFSFFIPVLGLVGLISALLISIYKPQLLQNLPFAKIALPEFDLSLHQNAPKFGQGGLKSRLMQTSLPTNQRLEALLALDGIPLRIASPMMQEMLNDSADDIRLIAYGILDAKEKIINAKIHEEKERLNQTTDSSVRLVCLRHLAELSWEHAYSGLAKGDLRLHTLESAEHYLMQAIKLAPSDAGLWFLRARLQHEQNRLDEASTSLHQALTFGLPEERALPYLAELAFDRKEYATVRILLGKIANTQVTQKMQDVIRYWTVKEVKS